jgi:NAD(P)-dependent dehydrogenase (short-subunit alcohol dehydrogenase family)
MSIRLEKKRFIAAGAATGIGRASALRLLEAGAHVAFWDRNVVNLGEVIKAAGDRKSSAFPIEVDVSTADSVRAAFSRPLQQLGGLDGAFNNAGIGEPPTPIETIEEADYAAVVSVSLKGVWLCMREQIRHFKANGGGVIVNNASVAGLVALPLQAAYGAAEHGVVGLTKVAAVEGAASGVRVNAICPGAVQTPILSHLEKAGVDQAAPVALSPQNRIADPREIADTVVWLLSDSSSFITGAAIPVDGGWSAQ